MLGAEAYRGFSVTQRAPARILLRWTTVAG
jgi:hypothetical protein